jgi:hypothetical protein
MEFMIDFRDPVIRGNFKLYLVRELLSYSTCDIEFVVSATPVGAGFFKEQACTPGAPTLNLQALRGGRREYQGNCLQLREQWYATLRGQDNTGQLSVTLNQSTSSSVHDTRKCRCNHVAGFSRARLARSASALGLADQCSYKLPEIDCLLSKNCILQLLDYAQQRRSLRHSRPYID